MRPELCRDNIILVNEFIQAEIPSISLNYRIFLATDSSNLEWVSCFLL